MLKRFFKRSEPTVETPVIASQAVLISIVGSGRTVKLTFLRDGELHDVECILSFGVSINRLQKDLLE